MFNSKVGVWFKQKPYTNLWLHLKLLQLLIVGIRKRPNPKINIYANQCCIVLVCFLKTRLNKTRSIKKNRLLLIFLLIGFFSDTTFYRLPLKLTPQNLQLPPMLVTSGTISDKGKNYCLPIKHKLSNISLTSNYIHIPKH